jgi:hypothetical protein
MRLIVSVIISPFLPSSSFHEETTTASDGTYSYSNGISARRFDPFDTRWAHLQYPRASEKYSPVIDFVRDADQYCKVHGNAIS